MQTIVSFSCFLIMKKLTQEQFLPVSLETAWNYFATPKNLNDITPSDMVFKIVSDLPEKMYEGMFIQYKIKPMLNIELNWCTEITHIEIGRAHV